MSSCAKVQVHTCCVCVYIHTCVPVHVIKLSLGTFVKYIVLCIDEVDRSGLMIEITLEENK